MYSFKYDTSLEIVNLTVAMIKNNLYFDSNLVCRMRLMIIKDKKILIVCVGNFNLGFCNLL